MKVEDKYTAPSWEKISRLPLMVAIGMEGAGRSGLAGSAQERRATILSMLSGRDSFPGNPLISTIVPSAEGAKAEMDMMRRHDAAMDFLAASGIRTSAALWDHIEACAREVMQLLRKHEAGHTSADYAQWLLRIASDVSVAAKEGDFLGIGGARVSKEEKSCYRRLEEALISAEE